VKIAHLVMMPLPRAGQMPLQFPDQYLITGENHQCHPDNQDRVKVHQTTGLSEKVIRRILLAENQIQKDLKTIDPPVENRLVSSAPKFLNTI
jgi:hypothetical protein